MSPNRIAAALRLLADAIEATQEGAPVETPPPEAQAPKRRVTDIDKARARRSLRRLGIDT